MLSVSSKSILMLLNLSAELRFLGDNTDKLSWSESWLEAPIILIVFCWFVVVEVL